MNEKEWKTIVDTAAPMTLNTEYYVAMANKLIAGKSSLNMRSAKLIRTTIMQIRKDDTMIIPYEISIRDFAKITGIETTQTLYRDIKKTCEELLKEIVVIGDKDDPKKAWKAFQWVSYCEYRDGYVYIKLNDELKPYLLGLQRLYTQYRLENIMTMKSVYSIRIYELLAMELRNTFPRAGTPIEITIMMDVLRRATDTEKKLLKSNDFKKRVIDTAKREINKIYQIFNIKDVVPVKRGRSIVGYTFVLENSSGDLGSLTPAQEKKIAEVKRNAKSPEESLDNQIYMSFDEE